MSSKARSQKDRSQVAFVLAAKDKWSNIYLYKNTKLAF